MRRWLHAERRAEFALEIHRFDDLVRWLRAGLITKADIDFGGATANQNFDPTKHILRPLPTRELNLNTSLQQNPKYN
jgi:starch-binding outer membrane protein, SusD/RagB family